MAEATFDLAIIGAGPAGHVAAERAGRLGKRVLVVERSHLGGVCLNQGCIPTKTLLHSAKLFAHAQHGQSFGVTVEGARYDLAKAMAWKTRTVETNRKGIAFQFRKAGVQLVQGTARLAGPRAIEVDGKTFGAERILLATGSSAATLPVPGADAPFVMGSTEALEIASLPKSIAIVGGGYIGMEFATYFARLGVKVAVVEMLPEIVPLLDAEIAVLLRRSLPEVEFHLGARVLAQQRQAPEGVLLFGGEPLVTVPEGTSGIGGRMLHYALLAARKIDGRDWAVLASGTDGIDGTSPAAGAIVTGGTMDAARRHGLDVERYLGSFDSYGFFLELERRSGERSLIVTGPTGTNVNDIMLWSL